MWHLWRPRKERPDVRTLKQMKAIKKYRKTLKKRMQMKLALHKFDNIIKTETIIKTRLCSLHYHYGKLEQYYLQLMDHCNKEIQFRIDLHRAVSNLKDYCRHSLNNMENEFKTHQESHSLAVELAKKLKARLK